MGYCSLFVAGSPEPYDDNGNSPTLLNNNLLTADFLGLVGIILLLIMTFTSIEMSAIAKLALAMAAADGKVEKSELSYIALELARFGVKDPDPILKGADDMDPSIALSVVSRMTLDEKKYVTAYLGTLMAVNGDIDEKELALWRLTSTLCGLPSMNIQEAINYIQNM